jgi:hypothetical protein
MRWKLSPWLGIAWVAFGLAALPCHGQEPVKTLISDVIYRADGTPAGGNLLITWPTFTTVDGKAVAAGKENVTIGAGGAVDIELAPNEGASPAGTYYRVVLSLNDGSTSTEYWTVPSTSPTTISAIRASVVPASIATQFATRSYVDQGLAAALLRTGDQTVDGVKSFSSSPLVPDPQAGEAAANKNYVDLAVASGGAANSIFPLTKGGTGQNTWTAARCVRVSGDGTKLESAASDCGGNAPYFDVMFQYGAKTDGSTDDTAALQSAINAQVAAGGGTVLLRPGAGYKITRQLTYEGTVSTAIKLSCSGQRSRNTGDCRVLWYGPKGGTMFLVLGANSSNVSDGISWIANAGGNSTAAQNAIWIDASNGATTTTCNISSISRDDSGIVSLTSATDCNWASGVLVKVAGVTGDTTFNGTFHVLYGDGNTAAGWVSGGPADSGTVTGATASNYASPGSSGVTITGSRISSPKSPQSTIATLSGTSTVTFTTSTLAYIYPLQSVIITGSTDTTYNGPYTVLSVNSTGTGGTLKPRSGATGFSSPDGLGASDGMLTAGSADIAIGHNNDGSQVSEGQVNNTQLLGDQLGTSMSAVQWLGYGNVKDFFFDQTDYNGTRYGWDNFGSGVLSIDSTSSSSYANAAEPVALHGAFLMDPTGGQISISNAETEDLGPTRFVASGCVGCNIKLSGVSYQSKAPNDDVVIKAAGPLVIDGATYLKNSRTGASSPWIQMGNLNLSGSATSSVVSLGTTYYRASAGGYIPVKDGSNNVFMQTGGFLLVNPANVTSIGDFGGASGQDVMRNYSPLNGAVTPVKDGSGSFTVAASAGARQFVYCSSTCIVTLPPPSLGLQFCIANRAGVSTVITLAALGSSAFYPKTDSTGYGTEGTGTMVSSGAAGDKVCLVGRDSTHYELGSFAGTWTVN